MGSDRKEAEGKEGCRRKGGKEGGLQSLPQSLASDGSGGFGSSRYEVIYEVSQRDNR